MTSQAFEQFANLLPEMLLLVNGNGVILSANRAFARWIGLDQASIAGTALMDVARDADQELRDFLGHCARTSEFLPGSLILVNRQGDQMHCRAEGRLIDPKTTDAPAQMLLRLINRDSSSAKFVSLNQRIINLDQEIVHRKKIERQLSASNEKLRAILSQAAAGVAQVDLAGHFILVNDRFCEITGYTRPELLQLRMPQITHPEDLPTSLEQFKNAIAEGGTYVMEKRYIRKDGSVVRVHNSAAAIRDPEGRIESIVGVILDVTGQRRHDQLLTEQNQLLELIIRGASLQRCLSAVIESIARMSPGLRACIVMANSERTAIADAFSTQFPASFGKSIAGTPISDIPLGTCSAAIYTGRSVSCRDVAGSTNWSAQWRELCLAHGIRACYSAPVLGPDDQAVASVLVCLSEAREPTDWEQRVAKFGSHIASIILDRDRMNQRLLENQQQLETELADSRLLQSVSAAMIGQEDIQSLYEQIIDAAAAIMHSDYASIQMFEAEHGPDGALRLLAHRGFTAEAASQWQWIAADSTTSCGAALRQGRRCVVSDMEQFDFTENDRAIYRGTGIAAMQSTPLFSRGGKVVGMISTHWNQVRQPSERELRLLDILARQAADIIERAGVEQALRDANHRKDEFLATLAHELRNPLSPIMNSLELLKRCGNDPEELEPIREIIRRQMKQMVRLVDDLLDVSRMARDRLELRRQRVDLNLILRDAVQACQPMADEMRHRLSAQLPEQVIYLDADPTRLMQIFGNLLNNACKYTPPGGIVQVSAQQQEQEIFIKFTDNGIGIPPEMQSRIFEMFQQVDKSLERSQGGLGIGLTLVKRLVEMHGGAISAYSAGAGTGSEFVVRLPVAAKPDADLLPTPAQSPPTAAAHGRRILVVDDNPDAAKTLAKLLKFSGNQIQTASNGDEALAKASSYDPQVILLDIGMPKINGYEVCREIRRKLNSHHPVMIALTGYGNDDDRRKSIEAGFDAHLVKPVDFEALTKLIESFPAGKEV